MLNQVTVNSHFESSLLEHSLQTAFFSNMFSNERAVRTLPFNHSARAISLNLFVKPAKSIVLKQTLGEFWKHFGCLWKHCGAFTWSPEIILAYSSTEINVFGEALNPLKASWSIHLESKAYFCRHQQRNRWVQGTVGGFSCSEINVFETPWGAPGGPQTSF